MRVAIEVTPAHTGPVTCMESSPSLDQPKMDPRAARTRKKLISAFREALEVDDPSGMSVAALTRKAGVSRASFYLHFDSAEALGLTALNELFDFISESSLDRLTRDHIPQDKVSRIAFSEVAAFVSEHPRLYSQLIGPGAAPSFIQAAVDALAAQTLASFELMGLRTDVDLDFASRFFAHASLGMIGSWLADGARTSHEELAAGIVACLPAWLVGTDV